MNPCKLHPKYKGKKIPTLKAIVSEECTCLVLYLMVKNKPRVGVMPTKVIKDKTKYTRKKKHKDEDD